MERTTFMRVVDTTLDNWPQVRDAMSALDGKLRRLFWEGLYDALESDRDEERYKLLDSLDRIEAIATMYQRTNQEHYPRGLQTIRSIALWALHGSPTRAPYVPPAVLLDVKLDRAVDELHRSRDQIDRMLELVKTRGEATKAQQAALGRAYCPQCERDGVCPDDAGAPICEDCGATCTRS